MRDDYYDDDNIAYDDIDDEWLDDEASYEEPVREPEPRRRPARAQERRRDRGGEEPAAERRRLPLIGRRDRDQEREDGTREDRDDRRNRDRADRRDRDRGGERPSRARSERTSAPAGSRGSTGNAGTSSAGTGSASALNDLILLAFKIGLVAMFLVLMTTFFFGITQVRETSMEPSFKEGDLVIYYRPDKDYSSRDAIVVDYNGTLQVRRVVAVAGDVVDISADGGLIINGSTQIEDDIYTTTYPYTDGITFPVTVGEGEVFVLGDNRTSAEDSRVYGTVRISATKGAVMTIIRRRGL